MPLQHVEVHRDLADGTTLRADVAIVGSGAGGAAVAGELSRAGLTSVVIEPGDLPHDRGLGTHLRNAHPPEADLRAEFGPRVLEGLVPYQNAERTLPDLRGQRFVHAIGGMMSFWSHVCAEPDYATEAEPDIPQAEMRSLWAEAAELLWANREVGAAGVRQRRLMAALRGLLPGLPADRGVQPLPIGLRHDPTGQAEYAGADALLSGLDTARPARITLVAGYAAQRIELAGSRASAVVAAAVNGPARLRIEADAVVTAAGALGSPMILRNSGIRLPALGRYLTDHTMVSSRIRLGRHVLAGADERDASFGVWIPSSAARLAHTQVVPPWTEVAGFDPGVPARETADIGQFVGVDPDPDNRLVFDDDRHDAWGLPVTTARFALGAADRERLHATVADHARVADSIRDTSVGLSISVAPPGGSLHLMGSTRLGSPETGVADSRGKVWGTDNLYVAGNGVVSTRTTSNPTVNVVAIALRTARAIAGTD
ncbi:GMC oxidoreductase [Streptomyces sp. DSM 44915]|uniref:GMC oxidoreductase n=1 Tax=Streptomyces chisholmiae TaxID=3075540 RepID=A0ABU2JRB7_9ACTN|nr:GMC oxidoreductase [Streptomyces sp. DSM 44915]MDT0267520.1 GMC oxidoreductase [Streptomyces sp. DSM 44915]